MVVRRRLPPHVGVRLSYSDGKLVHVVQAVGVIKLTSVFVVVLCPAGFGPSTYVVGSAAESMNDPPMYKGMVAIDAILVYSRQ